VEFTGQSLEKVQEETDRDNFMSPQQAMDLGLIDGVIR
jgi:ATP-dependent Clp protease, protease subunit